MKYLCLIVAALCLSFANASELVIKDKQDMDCHVYLPDPIDPTKTYQLVVWVHGAGGKGNDLVSEIACNRAGRIPAEGVNIQKRKMRSANG